MWCFPSFFHLFAIGAAWLCWNLSTGSLESHLMIILHHCTEHKQHISSPASMKIFFFPACFCFYFSARLAPSLLLFLWKASQGCAYFFFCWTVYNELIYCFVLPKSVHLQPLLSILLGSVCACIHACSSEQPVNGPCVYLCVRVVQCVGLIGTLLILCVCANSGK